MSRVDEVNPPQHWQSGSGKDARAITLGVWILNQAWSRIPWEAGVQELLNRLWRASHPESLLRGIAPYGFTTFNEHQLAAVLAESRTKPHGLKYKDTDIAELARLVDRVERMHGGLFIVGQ